MLIPFKTPVRYGQVIVLWLAIIVNYIHRINMSVGIVAMTSEKFVSNYGYPIYKWTEVEKSRVLSSFFWGYIALQIFFGNLVEKKGTKNILAVAVTLSSVCTIITPLAAEYGYMAVVALRVLEGLAQGALYPSLTVHVSKWVPPIERVGLLSLCLSGSAFSPLVGFPLCGYLAASSGGWPLAFYVPGALGFGWVALWLWIGANTPQDHETISDAERSYIITACRQDMQAITKAKTPWKAIFTSVPVYAVLISSIVETWGFWTLLAEMPNYLSSVLDLDMKENGLLSSLPYLSAYITSMLYTVIANYVRKNFNISKTLHRNFWNSVALWGSSSILLILTFMNKPSTFTAVMLFVLTVSLLTAKYNGYMTNPIDLSPNFCGTLVGITSTVGTLGPIFGPLSVGWLVDDPTSHEEWNSVFRLCSGIMFAGNLIYVIFSSSEVQPWNDQVKRYALKEGKGATDVENGETKTRL